MAKERVIFYIDGFNFYFGIKRARKKGNQWGRSYWIDMVKLCQSFLSENQELKKVVYFTAAPLNPQKSSRQSAFLNANLLRNKETFEVIRGKYIDKVQLCPYCNATINKPEEKRTDVNISVRIMEDCMLGNVDKIVLVSADSDLIPPLEFVQKHYPQIGIKVYFPPSNYSNDLKDNMLHHRSKPVLMEKNIRKFISAIMPDIVSLDGKSYTIPEKWKNF